MRRLFSSTVVIVCAAACPTTSTPPIVVEGEGDGGEGDAAGAGEGEGEAGEGEGEGAVVVDQVDVPDRACDVVSVDGVGGGAPHPLQNVIVAARLPLVRAPGRVDAISLDDRGQVAFVAHNVGDLVFGDPDEDADACFVHVAAYDGLTLELVWSETNHDVDLALAQERDGAFCAPNQVEFALDGVVTADCADDHFCDWSTCSLDGDYTVAFDGDAQPRHLGDARDGPATELIVLPGPTGRLLATAHSFDEGPSIVSVKAFLDDQLVAVSHDKLEANERGAPLLIDIDGGRSVATCVASDAGDDGCGVLVCPAACPDACSDVDGGCRPCEGCDASIGDGGCDHVTGHCHERCVDPADVSDDAADHVVLAEGTTDNVVCPGDVDVFVIDDVAAYDVVSVAVAPEVDVVLADAAGVIDAGGFVDAVVRAPPVVVRLHNADTQAGEGALRLAIDRLRDRCAADDAVEPDDIAVADGAPRPATTRADGILCPFDEVDCVEFVADDDRDIYLDRLAGDADCVIDGDPADGRCFDDGHVFRANAGEALRLCVRTTSTTPGTPWHFRSEAR